MEDPALLSPERHPGRPAQRDAAAGLRRRPGVHGDLQQAGHHLRAGRVHRQRLPRPRRRAPAAVLPVAAVRPRGPAAGHQPGPAVVAGQVQARPARHVQVRRREPRRRHARPVLPARHRGAPPAQGLRHRAGAGAGGAPPRHARLHPVPARGLRAPARRRARPGSRTGGRG